MKLKLFRSTTALRCTDGSVQVGLYVVNVALVDFATETKETQGS